MQLKTSMFGISTFEIKDKVILELQTECRVLNCFVNNEKIYIDVYADKNSQRNVLVEFKLIEIDSIESKNVFDSFILLNKIELAGKVYYVFMESLTKRKNELWNTFTKSYLPDFKSYVDNLSYSRFTPFDSTKYQTEKDLRDLAQIWRKELHDSGMFTIIDWILDAKVIEKDLDPDNEESLYVTTYETDTIKFIREENLEDSYHVYIKKFNNWIEVIKPYSPVDFSKTDFISFVPAPTYLDEIKKLALEVLAVAEDEYNTYLIEQNKRVEDEEVTELMSDILFKLSC